MTLTQPARLPSVAAAMALAVGVTDPAKELRLAAIDIGSNSIHMVIAHVDAAGGVTTLWRQKEMVGLGRMSFPSRRLSREAIDRALGTLARFKAEALHRGCVYIVAVATSAVREAQNGGDFIERARREAGLAIQVITAREEARLIYLGACHDMDCKGGPRVVMDIGGGSVEFVVAGQGKPLLLESRKLGASRMTARYVKSDPIASSEVQELLRHYERELTPICRDIQSHHPVAMVGTSGTLENLAALCGSGSSDAKSPGVIDRSRLKRVIGELIDSTAAKRQQMRGLDDQRKDQILAGALLTHDVMRRLGFEQMTLCRSALREGMLLDYLSRHLPELKIRLQVPDPRRRSVLDLARRCAWNAVHGGHVAALTLDLFDQLKPLHGLGRADRELIEYGALLHDVGLHIARQDHHKHSMYLIEHGNLKGFTRDEVRTIACVARYHRKAGPQPKHELYNRLSRHARRVVRVGAALLRVADGLDRSHCSVVTAVRTRTLADRIDLTVEAHWDAELELWAARKRADFFGQAFGRELVIKGPR